MAQQSEIFSSSLQIEFVSNMLGTNSRPGVICKGQRIFSSEAYRAKECPAFHDSPFDPRAERLFIYGLENKTPKK
jgi:hypothetical protein